MWIAFLVMILCFLPVGFLGETTTNPPQERYVSEWTTSYVEWKGKWESVRVVVDGDWVTEERIYLDEPDFVYESRYCL